MRLKLPERKPGYRERVHAQTFQWARGFPYHNRIDDECCPDFSCCIPEMFEKDEGKRWEIYRKEQGSRQ